jgi:SOS-response transcriptional repressor LexA
MTGREQYGLTPTALKMLAFIREQISSSGVSPSYDEISQHMGLASKSGVTRLVEQLEERGHIHRLPGLSRSITIVETPDALLDVLPVRLRRRLIEHCRAKGETPEQFVIDAVTLLLDDTGDLIDPKTGETVVQS